MPSDHGHKAGDVAPYSLTRVAQRPLGLKKTLDLNHPINTPKLMGKKQILLSFLSIPYPLQRLAYLWPQTK